MHSFDEQFFDALDGLIMMIKSEWKREARKTEETEKAKESKEGKEGKESNECNCY